MWPLLRVTALVVLGLMGLLVVGLGDRLLEIVDATLAWAGTGTVRRDAAPLPTVTVVGGLAGGVVMALAGPVRPVTGQLVTLLHELGHTVVATALGARPDGIVLRHDASGHASARWTGQATPLRRLSLAAVAFAGLPAPAAVSAAGTQLLLLTGPRAVLWSVTMAGIVVVLLARSAWSLLIAAALAALAVLALGEPAEPWAVGVVIGLVTAIAMRTTVDNLRRARRPIQAGDDARVAAARLGLPSRLVQFLQIAAGGLLSTWTLWPLVEDLLGTH